jgi:hypothetical protein
MNHPDRSHERTEELVREHPASGGPGRIAALAAAERARHVITMKTVVLSKGRARPAIQRCDNSPHL